MAESCDTNLEGCLYYSVNSLARSVNELAVEAFKITGIAPAYSYVMLVILKEPGLRQRKIADQMNLKASTITRFVDKLVKLGFVERIHEGRNTFIHPTEEGIKFKVIIQQSLKILHDSYCDKLGEDLAKKLTTDIQNARLCLDE